MRIINLKRPFLLLLPIAVALALPVGGCGRYSGEWRKVGPPQDTEVIIVHAEYDEVAAPPVEVTARLDALGIDAGSVTVNWGDKDEWFPGNDALAMTHTYLTSGEYTFRVQGRGSYTGQLVTNSVTFRIGPIES